MFIRYHLFYYALGCLTIILGYYFHSLFYLVFCLYLMWLNQRLTWKHMMICLCLSCLIIIFPHNRSRIENGIVEGTVIKMSEHYCYVKTYQGIIKLYHQYDFQYHDDIKVAIQNQDWNIIKNDHGFDEKKYCYGQNVFHKARIMKLYEVHHHHTLYHWIENHLSQNQKVQSYQRLLLLGEKDENIQNDYEKLSEFSLIHLFALSGMHVHILYSIIYMLLSLFLGEKISKILTYIIIGSYIFAIPFQISLYRAFFALLLYEIGHDYFHQLDILSFLMIISLFHNPYYIYNMSFIFSYFVYFIVIITKNLRYSYIWIFLSTIPLILYLHYQIPIFSLFIGVWFSPFIELFYTLCCLSVLFSVLENAILLGVLCLEKIYYFLNHFSIFISLSKPTFLFIIFFYIIFFLIIYRITIKQKISSYICILLSLFFVFNIYSQYKIYGEITMIDVGQGDCTLIRLPLNQGNILIDTGGNHQYDLATQTIIPYLRSIGVHQLDYVYISHDDFDHCGALESLQKNFLVKHVIKEFEAYRKIGHIEIIMLEHSYSSDSNDQSLVMYVRFPSFSVLFTGDASSEVEKELKIKYPHLSVDILKISHHGSATATSVDLLEWIYPDVAMISVKKNNLYHHPAPIVIERLKRKGIKILRTDENGMFHIRYYFSEGYQVYQ